MHAADEATAAAAAVAAAVLLLLLHLSRRNMKFCDDPPQCMGCPDPLPPLISQ
jgi:MYXO-CTERM domain-containing protein